MDERKSNQELLEEEWYELIEEFTTLYYQEEHKWKKTILKKVLEDLEGQLGLD